MNGKTMTVLSKEEKTKVAVKLVIMDAIEKGHTNKKELIAYMNSGVFDRAVKRYVSLMNETIKQ